MKKMIFCMIIFISLLMIAYVEEGIAGPPAPYVMTLGKIFANGSESTCYACYLEEGGDCIGSANFEASSMVLINKNRIEVTCHFQDFSQNYEATAQVVNIINCELWAGALYLQGGTGKIITAANHGDNPEEYGGTATMSCTFDFDVFNANYCNCDPCDSCCPE